MTYKEFKCTKCGWVHSAIPLADAEAQVASTNAYDASKGRSQTASLSHSTCAAFDAAHRHLISYPRTRMTCRQGQQSRGSWCPGSGSCHD